VSGIERIKSPELAEWLATALAQLDVSSSLGRYFLHYPRVPVKIRFRLCVCGSL
jgi:hypothetical protein